MGDIFRYCAVALSEVLPLIDNHRSIVGGYEFITQPTLHLSPRGDYRLLSTLHGNLGIPLVDPRLTGKFHLSELEAASLR